jgi:aminotransferase MxcL
MNQADSTQHVPHTSPALGAHGQALVLSRSEALLAEARSIIPGLTQSMMKRPEAFAPGAFPAYLCGGSGALVEDVDGQTYIDFICGLGANTLGHNHPAVVRAITDALGRGLLHSLPAEVELTATRALLGLIPHAEMARFFKTGADATSAAVRLARHLTGRSKVVTIGYNGWHDHFMFDTPGVPAVLREYTLRMPLAAPTDEPALLSLLRERGPEIAAVLLSVPYNRELSRELVHALRNACSEQGVMFVLDEVVTGFRLARGGAQEYFGVAADFVCLSKGLAAGMPLSAIAGPRDKLARLAELQVSTTFGGELLSLEVCRAALEVYAHSDYVEHVARLGLRLKQGINAFAEERGLPVRVRGYDAIPCFGFAEDLPTHTRIASAFVGAMARRGVLLRRDVNFVGAAHSEAHVDYTIHAACDALRELEKRGELQSGGRA